MPSGLKKKPIVKQPVMSTKFMQATSSLIQYYVFHVSIEL